MKASSPSTKVSDLDTQVFELPVASVAKSSGRGDDEDEPTRLFIATPRVGVKSVGETHYGEAIVFGPASGQRFPTKPSGRHGDRSVTATHCPQSPSARRPGSSGRVGAVLRSFWGRVRANRLSVASMAVLSGIALGAGVALGAGATRGSVAISETPHREQRSAPREAETSDDASVPQDSEAGENEHPPGSSWDSQGVEVQAVEVQAVEVQAVESQAVESQAVESQAVDPNASMADVSAGHSSVAGLEPDISFAVTSRQALIHQIKGRCRAAATLYERLRADADLRGESARVRLLVALRRGSERACGADFAGRSGAVR